MLEQKSFIIELETEPVIRDPGVIRFASHHIRGELAIPEIPEYPYQDISEFLDTLNAIIWSLYLNDEQDHIRELLSWMPGMIVEEFLDNYGSGFSAMPRDIAESLRTREFDPAEWILHYPGDESSSEYELEFDLAPCMTVTDNAAEYTEIIGSYVDPIVSGKEYTESELQEIAKILLSESIIPSDHWDTIQVYPAMIPGARIDPIHEWDFDSVYRN